MVHRLLPLDDLAERLDTQLEVFGDEAGGHVMVARLRFDTVLFHGLVRHHEEGARGDLVRKAGREERGGLHVDARGMRQAEVLLEVRVVLPHAAVGGIDRPGPIILPPVAYGRRDGAQEREGGQRGHFRREVLVRRPFAPYGCDGEQVIAQPVRLLQSPAFAEEERRLGAYGREEVHDGGRIGASHAKVDDRNPVGRRVGHRSLRGQDGYAIVRREALHVGREVRQQHMPREIFQPPLRIAGQPILYNFLFRLHASAFLHETKVRNPFPSAKQTPHFFVFDGHSLPFRLVQIT